MFGFAATKCGKCEKSAFKVQELSLKGELDYKIISVQCAYCKTPIGIIDDNNARLEQQQARMAGRNVEHRPLIVVARAAHVAVRIGNRQGAEVRREGAGGRVCKPVSRIRRRCSASSACAMR